VLDLTQGMAGPLATVILADFGADVVRVEPPEGDPGWETPGYLLLQRGKQSIRLDLDSPAGQAEVRRLAPGFDVVIETLGPGRAEQAGIGYDALAAINPALVYCSVTGFGPTGPFAQVKADDGLVMAKAGILKDQPGWFKDSRRPVYRASPDGSYFAAMLAVQGVLAALRARDLTGRGQLVETNLLQALTSRQNPSVGWLLRDGEELPAEARKGPAQDDPNQLAHHRDPRQVGITGMLVECKDGRWITHALTEPHFFPAWIKAIGFEWIWQDDRFKGAPHQFADPDVKAELVVLIEQRMKEKTAAEWMETYVANGDVCADVVETTQEALSHPQVVAAGYLAELDDPRVGRVVEVGPLARLPQAPASVDSAAPVPGQHTDEVLKASVAPVAVAPPTRASLTSPLEGITIVEAAYYYATPFATALLADLGARVIKIERLIGDPYRKLAAGSGTGDMVRNLGHNNMARAMQGKESIAINLKDDRGREILHQLVAKADVFVHNFRPGVPESLGMDYDTLMKVNPGLVYQYGASYGSTGPYARQPAIDPVIAAFSGHTAYQAGEGNPPLTETGADPIAAAGHAVAMMLGLYARHRTGQSQYVESAMILSNLFANCQDALSYQGKPPRPMLDHYQFGTAAARRLYETAPADGSSGPVEPWENPDPHWVFLSAESDDEFARFCQVAGRQDLAGDPRFATAGAREQHRSELEAALEPVFRTRTARDWETSMLAAGVGCVTADAMSHFAFLFKDAQAQALNMMTTSEHRSFGGTYWRHAPLINFSETPGEARPFCEKGEHTRAILSELGYDDAQMADLLQANVVTWPAEEAEVATVG
jgi:crotonobetainyl-CoA:carnitine CoA-transferase CaiB-like acyl-CoA transferase